MEQVDTETLEIYATYDCDIVGHLVVVAFSLCCDVLHAFEPIGHVFPEVDSTIFSQTNDRKGVL